MQCARCNGRTRTLPVHPGSNERKTCAPYYQTRYIEQRICIWMNAIKVIEKCQDNQICIFDKIYLRLLCTLITTWLAAGANMLKFCLFLFVSLKFLMTCAFAPVYCNCDHFLLQLPPWSFNDFVDYLVFSDLHIEFSSTLGYQIIKIL